MRATPIRIAFDDHFATMPLQRAAAQSSPASGRDVQQSTGERPLGEPQQERAVEP
jgi:hypothetical protein